VQSSDLSWVFVAWLASKVNLNLDRMPGLLKYTRTHDEIGWNEDYVKVVELHCGYRRFFFTEKGYLGLGPNKIEAQDQVCIIFGGKTPFILRKVEEHYKLIGEAYIHGKTTEKLCSSGKLAICRSNGLRFDSCESKWRGRHGS